MSKSFRAATFVIIIIALSTAAYSQKGKPPKPSPTPTPTPPVVRATFNYCTAGDTACQSANRVRMDVDRPYTSGQEGVSIAGATGTTGDIVIYLGDSTRSVVYDLRDVVHTGNPQPTWTSTPQNFKVQFVLHDANLLKTAGACATSAVCEANMVSALNGGFYIGRVRYRFQWNPWSVLEYINSVEDTSPVNIYYTRDASGQTWTVTPIETVSGRYLAGMQVEDRNRITFGGQYNMPFRMVITVQ
jgi:hypothetical protein